jgi:demethylmenaquinone methyltransferase/2-methoxy-6-polyprenyl-1,4-benzoquinol methylase
MRPTTDTPPATPRQRLGGGTMFDGIAPRYDLLNRLTSLGLDTRWRGKLVASVADVQPRRILDLATGTGDVALALAKRYPQAQVTGIDPSRGMLERAEAKLARCSGGQRVRLLLGSAHALPLSDGECCAATIAFGIRNVPDRALGLAELTRVVRPGGLVSVLELGQPRGLLGSVARFHMHRVVPALGALLSSGAEYRYLSTSIAAFPQPEVFVELMREAGLVDVEAQPLTLGVVHLFRGRVPGGAS